MSSPLQNTAPFTVQPGPPAMLLAQMPAGTLIVNNDSTNGVWLSDQPGLTPGSGFNVGPLGSVTWQTLGPCYACVDTGVTVPVGLTVGTAATNPDNPVAVGAAVAAQLLVTGVPSVYLTDNILPTTALAPFANSPVIPIAQYASLNILFYVYDPSSATVIQMDHQNNIIKQDVISLFDGNGPSSSLPVTVRIPVVGTTVSVLNSSVAGTPAFTVTIDGTNRLLDRPRSTGNGYRIFTYTGALAIGAKVIMNSGGGNYLDGYVYSSESQLQYTISYVGTSQVIPFFRAVMGDGSTQDLYLASSSPYAIGSVSLGTSLLSNSVPLGTVAIGLQNVEGTAIPSTTYSLKIVPNPTS